MPSRQSSEKNFSQKDAKKEREMISLCRQVAVTFTNFVEGNLLDLTKLFFYDPVHLVWFNFMLLISQTQCKQFHSLFSNIVQHFFQQFWQLLD